MLLKKKSWRLRMLKVRLSRQFRKDLEKARKRGLKIKKLDKVVLKLQ